MLAKAMLSQILRDEALTRHLGDPEARLLVEWLVDQAERLASAARSEQECGDRVRRLCVRGRAIGRFVCLWCYQRARGAAIQLAATERFHWPLPTAAVDPCDLMFAILEWETQHASLHPASACA
jgi:hypothetical protein